MEYGETHTRYQRPFAFHLLKGMVQLHSPCQIDQQEICYVLDKSLDNACLSSQGQRCILRHDVRIIYLVRNPADTIRSLYERIVESSDHTFSGKDYLTVLPVYRDRLAKLKAYAQWFEGKPSFALTYDQLVHQTPLVFQKLQAFLQLRDPLREDYRLFASTGQPGVGDMSTKLRAGTIVRNRPGNAPDNLLSPQVHAILDRAYQEAFEAVAHVSKSINSL